MKSNQIFKSKDIDLITYLCFKGFKPNGVPVEDTSGIRWILFEDSPQLQKAVFSFLSGNDESRLLSEFRKTRSLILDTKPIREEKRER